MRQLLIITGDTNDDDLVTKQCYIKDEKELEMVKRVLAVIKTKTLSMAGGSRHNWPSSDYCSESVQDLYKGLLSEDDIEWFNEYVPYGEFGIHTIRRAVLYEIQEEEKLFEYYDLVKLRT